MTKEQWNIVEGHFDELVDQPAAQRDARLAAIDDEEVRREVCSLLQYTAGAGTITKAVDLVATDVEAESIRSQRLGVYRLVRRLGQGGQGAVFEATRDEGTFEQRVAIKIVRWENDSETARNQFRHERQILAGLEHPNIARLLDGGEAEDGTPYIVMEYIDGLPMTAATQGWPLKRKLRLFIQAASAVAFAHRNLIVHRDLAEPSQLSKSEIGILFVFNKGTPKVSTTF